MIIASPHWRRLASGNILDGLRFCAETSRRVSYPYNDKPELGDATAHWAIADSWRPSSAPTNTYSPARVNGALPPLHRAQARRHEQSALWFSRNRKAGAPPLRHLHIRPVIDRPWAPKYERTEGSIWHSKQADPQFLDWDARRRAEEGA
ncbi:hypothetical protein ACFW2Y_20190 [Streptomyces sp. NPDC058877]|uniref:hypothetical protein n=1 Tax=Streptomyces sp. NPDC058877 TaxID=3346665 RepID=UPI00369F9545